MIIKSPSEVLDLLTKVVRFIEKSSALPEVKRECRELKARLEKRRKSLK